MGFDQGAFDQFILENKVIGFFDEPVTLKSGQKSHWYVNWRPITSQVHLIDSVARFILAFAKEQSLQPDCYFGVPEGATKLGVITQYLYAQSRPDETFCLPMGRSKPKAHGAISDRFFVGAPEGDVVLLEDVTTTGGSLYECITQLQDLPINIIAAIGLTDRRDGNPEPFQKMEALGIPYYALSHGQSLVEKLSR